MVRARSWVTAIAIWFAGLAESTGTKHVHGHVARLRHRTRLRSAHANHRHHMRHASLASARVAQEMADLGVDDLLDHPEVPEVVDGVEEYKIHPLVSRQLGKMSGELRDLEAAKGTAEVDQQKFEDVQGEATKHMSKGAELRREIARAQATSIKVERKLKRSQGEGARIESSRKQLEQSLQNAMGPKIRAAEMRFMKRRKDAGIEKAKVDGWALKQDEYKTVAMRRLQDRRAKAETLKAADEALGRLQQEQKTSEEQYEEARKVASRVVEEYRYVETNFQGAESKLKELEPEIEEEQKSLNKMRNVLKFESERIQQAEAMKQEQLKRVEAEEEKQHLNAESEVLFLKKRYTDWREAEQERAAVVAQRKHAYAAALESYQDKRADVYNTAQNNAAVRANQDADWADNDDWAWGGSLADPQDQEVHFQQ